MSVDKIRNSIDLKKDNWINMEDTNCYAYALGLDIKEDDIMPYAYIPGTISNSKDYLPKNAMFTNDMLINNIYLDLDFLGIDYREINPKDKIDSDEWKIALFISYIFGNNYDYHFLREVDNIWYHKNGYGGPISKYDSKGRVITNPKNCNFNLKDYNRCLSLRLK